MEITKNEFTHLTAKERRYMSFPTKHLMNRGLLKGRILDFGCGFGKDVEELQKRGMEIVGYDPHFFTKEPEGKFDTVLCNYVLNVLKPEEQTRVLIRISKLLNEGGKAYYSVRRDLRHEGFRLHKIHKKPTFQMMVFLPFPSLFKNESCEIYEFTRFVDLPRQHDCVFCSPSMENFIFESAVAYAIWDKYPVTEGHALVICKRHVPSFFDLTEHEKRSCLFLVDELQKMIKKEHGIEDFNIGINVGANAGQTVNHVHIHLIPRRSGDVENPVGGIRNVIPGMGDYRFGM